MVPTTNSTAVICIAILAVAARVPQITRVTVAILLFLFLR